MREEYLLWDCEEFQSFEAAKKAAERKKKGYIEVLKIIGGNFVVERQVVWGYKSGFINPKQ